MIAFRFPFAVGLGAVLSLGLFFVLWGFISRPLAVAPATKATVVDFRRLRVDTPPETKRREKVQHEPAPVVPEVPTIGMGSGSEGSVFSLPTICSASTPIAPSALEVVSIRRPAVMAPGIRSGSSTIPSTWRWTATTFST